MGLGVGADQYVTKPFAPRALVARVRAHVRRSRNEGRELVRFGPYVLDVGGYTPMREGTWAAPGGDLP